ncbi:hypothetical protein ACWOAH_10360 [Vagococcus vulneris]|uniref:Uncharacterized protein n=1 Tax=Vagococcus vulneris TaxID=1977869 RepID=A0A429ZTF4_9ENTE|nr:hypothetical protein [Vagococcus vulneris]RST96966.1 hypothetical protein CBF37_10440 [Vagococcus vulneris]
MGARIVTYAKLMELEILTNQHNTVECKDDSCEKCLEIKKIRRQFGFEGNKLRKYRKTVYKLIDEKGREREYRNKWNICQKLKITSKEFDRMLKYRESRNGYVIYREYVY